MAYWENKVIRCLSGLVDTQFSQVYEIGNRVILFKRLFPDMALHRKCVVVAPWCIGYHYCTTQFMKA